MADLPLSPLGRRYGYLRDPKDYRDLGLSAMRLIKPTGLPAVVDLESSCGPVKDQGDIGACTAFAGTGLREFLYRRYTENEKAKVVPTPIFSPLFMYYMERELDGSLGDGDCGSYGRTACRVMNRIGVCLESSDPYNVSRYAVQPTTTQLAQAGFYTAGAYHRIYGVQDMKACLASGYVAMIGFAVYESFEKIGSDGIMPTPDKNREDVLGGHETLVIGYDDTKEAFKVRNSWGIKWGASGNFWFGYEQFSDPDILMDSWMEHLGKAW
jgi:C1A family cysteine protease